MSEEGITYSELKEIYCLEKASHYSIKNATQYFEKMVACIIDTQQKRIKLNKVKDEIWIDITKNRDVAFTLKQLDMIKELFEADELVVSSPIRCKLRIKIVREENG